MQMDVREAYRLAKDSVVLYDRAETGRVRLSGEDRIEFLQRMSTADFRGLRPGGGISTVLTSDIGRVIDWVVVYVGVDELLIVTGPDRAERDMAHLLRYILFRDRVSVVNVTDETAHLTLIGPDAGRALLDLTGEDVCCLAPDHCQALSLNGADVLVARNGRLAVPAFNILCEAQDRDRVVAALAGRRLLPISRQVYDILRVEAGVPEYGRELSEQVNPLEAGLRASVSFDKGCYIGQEVVARLDTYDKVQKRLMGVRLAAPIPAGASLRADGANIGSLTTSVQSPDLGPIALAFVRKNSAQPGTKVNAEADGQCTQGEIVALPF